MSPNAQYDENYCPLADEVQLLSENDWNFPLETKPEWLGFKHENKPYKFVEAPRPSSSSCYKSERIINPYLKRAFDLKKNQCVGSRVIVGFHATKPQNIESIAENNFNWRLAGRNRGFKHGKGVCFSNTTSFAEQFCESLDKRIIQVEFICSSVEVGYKGDILPRNKSDTSKSPNGNVWVKFEDSAFLPLYVYHWRSRAEDSDEDIFDVYFDYSSDSDNWF